MSYKILLAVFVMLLIAPAHSIAGIPINIRNVEQQSKSEKKSNETEKSDEKPKKNRSTRNADLAFIFGLGSLIIAPLVIPGFIFGLKSLRLNEAKQGYAITGVAMGGLYILLFLIFLVLLFLGAL